MIRDLNDLWVEGDQAARAATRASWPDWRGRVLIHEDNLSYLVWNEKSREALIVDPTREDWDAWRKECQALEGYRFLGVIDTHTHADHVSCAGRLARELRAPLVMHEQAPCSTVDLRISRDFAWSTASGPMSFLHTPGHTSDSVCLLWGPWLFVGDVLLFSDSGRNDLPGGDAVAHADSFDKLRAEVPPAAVVLVGHDGKGGRICSWKYQLENNPSLLQSRESFIAEAQAYSGPAPKHLKESLFENTK